MKSNRPRYERQRCTYELHNAAASGVVTRIRKVLHSAAVELKYRVADVKVELLNAL